MGFKVSLLSVQPSVLFPYVCVRVSMPRCSGRWELTRQCEHFMLASYPASWVSNKRLAPLRDTRYMHEDAPASNRIRPH